VHFVYIKVSFKAVVIINTLKLYFILYNNLFTMANFNCTECNRTFATKASLCSHRTKFHKNNSSTIAVLQPLSKVETVRTLHNSDDELDNNLEIVSQVDASENERDRLMMAQILNLSDSDSDSDDSIFPDDKTHPNTSNKRSRTLNSNDEEPAPKVQRNISTDSSVDDEGSVDIPVVRKKKLVKKRKRVSDSSDDEPTSKVQRNISTDSSDDEGSVDIPVIRKKKLVKKRKRVSDSSDEEPTPKVHRKRHSSTDPSDNGDSDVDMQLFDTKLKINRLRNFSRNFSSKKNGHSKSVITKNEMKRLRTLETKLLEDKVDNMEDRYALDCTTMDADIRERDKIIAELKKDIKYIQEVY
jgi:hypothetical protein